MRESVPLWTALGGCADTASSSAPQPQTTTSSDDIPWNGYANGDGFYPSDDCDAGNRPIDPGAPELCDHWDSDRDWLIDEGQRASTHDRPFQSLQTASAHVGANNKSQAEQEGFGQSGQFEFYDVLPTGLETSNPREMSMEEMQTDRLEGVSSIRCGVSTLEADSAMGCVCLIEIVACWP